MLVLYDSACPFCERCRHWLEGQRALVPLTFLCCRSGEARLRYGHIEELGRELVVVDGAGRYWVGPAAFVVCLFALAGWRWLASLAASDFVWPLARVLFAEVSAQRGVIGRAVGVSCTAERCGLPPAQSPHR